MYYKNVIVSKVQGPGLAGPAAVPGSRVESNLSERSALVGAQPRVGLSLGAPDPWWHSARPGGGGASVTPPLACGSIGAPPHWASI